MDYIVLVNGRPVKKWYAQRYQGDIISKMANVYAGDDALPTIRYKSKSKAIDAAKWVSWVHHPEVWSVNGDELLDKIWSFEMEGSE